MTQGKWYINNVEINIEAKIIILDIFVKVGSHILCWNPEPQPKTCLLLVVDWSGLFLSKLCLV